MRAVQRRLSAKQMREQGTSWKDVLRGFGGKWSGVEPTRDDPCHGAPGTMALLARFAEGNLALLNAESGSLAPRRATSSSTSTRSAWTNRKTPLCPLPGEMDLRDRRRRTDLPGAAGRPRPEHLGSCSLDPGALRCGRVLAIAVLMLVSACTGGRASPPTFRPTVAAAACPPRSRSVPGPHLRIPDGPRGSDPPQRADDQAVLPARAAGAVHPSRSRSPRSGKSSRRSPSYDTGIAESSNRELILLDQRGTGHSKPSLACPEVDAVAGDLVAGLLSSETVRDAFRDRDRGMPDSTCRRGRTSRGVHPGGGRRGPRGASASARRAQLEPHLLGSASRLLLEYARRHPSPSGRSCSAHPSSPSGTRSRRRPATWRRLPGLDQDMPRVQGVCT